MKRNKSIESYKIVFLIIDGWGIYESYGGNAIALAPTPVFNKLVKEYPATAINTAVNFGPSKNFHSRCESGHYILGGLSGSHSGGRQGLIKNFLDAGKRVLIVAESERYAQMAHYFCHGDLSHEENFESCVVSSPKLDSYKEYPELSAAKVIDKICKAVNSEKYDLVAGSLANPDMLAHTGDLEATSQAVAVVDKLLRKVLKACLNRKNILVISSDHGNAEYMLDKRGNKPHLGHTDNPVPFILVGPGYEGRNIGWPDVIGDDLSTTKTSGNIADVAPTLLHLAGLAAPPGLRGRSLINN